MIVTNTAQAENESDYDRKSELKAFDDSKAGVKGLVDTGWQRSHVYLSMSNITPMKYWELSPNRVFQSSILKASIMMQFYVLRSLTNVLEEKLDGVINHGIPTSVLEEMLDGVRKFYEQDIELKKPSYSRGGITRKAVYNSNFDLYAAPATNWRDTLDASWLQGRSQNLCPMDEDLCSMVHCAMIV